LDRLMLPMDVCSNNSGIVILLLIELLRLPLKVQAQRHDGYKSGACTTKTFILHVARGNVRAASAAASGLFCASNRLSVLRVLFFNTL